MFEGSGLPAECPDCGYTTRVFEVGQDVMHPCPHCEGENNGQSRGLGELFEASPTTLEVKSRER